MDMNKYKALIDLVINEDNEQARELFHEIVIEKSREIFESIMSEEEGMGGQVGDLIDELDAEEAGEGMYEDEDEFAFGGEAEGEDGEEEIEFGGEEEDFGPAEGADEVEDAVIRIEDKLDQLMAEFEELMGGEGEGEEDYDSEEEVGGDIDMDADADFGDEEDEDAVMEAVQLQKVSVTHGDNGQNTKSTVKFNSGQNGMASRPVKFAGDSEAVPTSPKAPSNPYTKGETQVKGAGSFKNAPGKKSQDLSSAPKPKHGDDGSNSRSPVAESRRAKRPLK